MESQEKVVKQKSMQFPSESLPESIDFVTKIVSTRGEQISKIKEISLATGIPEGSLPLTMSTANQYGLLENLHGSGYRPTSLFTEISTPTFETDRDQAMFTALSNPPLYKIILEEFNGKILPNEKGFINYLSKYGFKPYAVPKITRAFFENFKAYIDSNNNRLRFIQAFKGSGELLNGNNASKEIEIEDSEQKLLVAHSVPNSFKQTIPLPGGKMIILEYPKGNMTAEDFEALSMFINFLALSEGIKKNNP